MKVTVTTVGWNESETIIPLIRYYLNICNFDRFIYFDNFSSDDTIEKIKRVFKNDSRVVIKYTPYVGHMPVDEVHLINETMRSDDSDIFFWIDSDEVIYHRNFRSYLEKALQQGRGYIATYMSNVYNDTDTFLDSKENIIDNFTLCHTNKEKPIFKVPIIIKRKDTVQLFGGGHHSITIDGISYGDFALNPLDKNSFADEYVHLFHFTYINKETYYRRKTLGRERNIKLGIDNSWYHNYWNQTLDEISIFISNQKKHSVGIEKYL